MHKGILSKGKHYSAPFAKDGQNEECVMVEDDEEEFLLCVSCVSKDSISSC